MTGRGLYRSKEEVWAWKEDELFFFNGSDDPRNLHTAYRRQRQMCIRDRPWVLSSRPPALYRKSLGRRWNRAFCHL
ncbi:hypothetical protein CDFC105_13853 [Clostridioides difficile]|nr:hypothetical protein CDFC105_13853 [Clostridioides difficile]